MTDSSAAQNNQNIERMQSIFKRRKGAKSKTQKKVFLEKQNPVVHSQTSSTSLTTPLLPEVTFDCCFSILETASSSYVNATIP